MHYLKQELFELIKQDLQLFDFIQEAAPDGIWYRDLEQPDHEWKNPGFWKTLGYDPESMPHRRDALENIIFEQDLEASEKRIRACMEAPHARDYVQIIRYHHKQGHTVRLRCRAKLILNDDGKAVRLLGGHYAITELEQGDTHHVQKKNEQRLIETERIAVRRGRMLKAAAESNALLNQKTWERALPASLEYFGKALDVDRTYYFNIEQQHSDALIISMKYEWTRVQSLAELGKPQNDNLVLNPSHGELYYGLRQGRSFEAKVSELPESPVRSMLEEQSIKTIFVCPVLFGSQFMGIIGFDDCRHERSILREEQELIKTFASSLGRSIMLQQKQQALEASETKLRNFLNSSTESIILLSPGLKVMMLNSAAYNGVRGYFDGAELKIGDDIQPFILPGARTLFYDAIERAKQGEVMRIEYEAHFGSQKKWLEFNYFPVRNPDGSLMGISLITVDIDQRKQAEEQLQASEERLRGMLASQTNYLIRTDLHANYTYANQKFRDTFRFLHGDEELIGRNVMDSIMQEDQQMVQEKVFYLLNHPQEILQFEIRKPVVGDKAMTSLWEFSCITDTEGNPVEIQCIGLDITDRKADEQKLRQHEAYQRSLIKAIPEMLFVVNRDGRYLDYNADSKFHYSEPESFLGKKMEEVLPAELVAKNYEAIAKTQNSSAPVELRYSLEIKGQPEHFKARYVALGNDKVVMSVSNVTDSVNNLNRIEALLHTEEEQNKRLRNFTHIVSHNLRNHTANIQGVLSVMEMDYPELYEHEYLVLLQKTADNLSETIKHLNEVLDINLNKPAERSSLNLRKMLESTIDSVHLLAQNAGVEIMSDVPAQLYFKTIPAYLQSIMLNMLTNGIKYRSHERPSCVKVSARLLTTGLELRFEDNGLGIDLDKFGGKLFGMYKTFHHHEDSRGLGLYITKNQVEALGGRIEVESSAGRGSCFRVFLPFEGEAEHQL